jgi:hypothetical protein
MMKLQRTALTGPVVLAMFAFSVSVVSSASAEVAPSFTVDGTRLVAGKTHNTEAKTKAPFVLTNTLGSAKVECTELGGEQSPLMGSNPENPGTSVGTATFSGCINATGSNGANCHLAPSEGSTETSTVIRTEPLRGEEVDNVVSGTKGNQLLGEISPLKGAVFTTLFFSGECTLLATKVSGQVVAEVILDNSSEGTIELGQAAQERTSWLLRFPSTPITQVWLITNGVGKIRKTEQTAFGEKSIQTGKELLELASTKSAPEPNALWSPLP